VQVRVILPQALAALASQVALALSFVNEETKG